MIAMNHASNVVGTLLPVREVGALAKRHGALLLVDAAQTAGAYPIDVQALNIDLLGFTGHKALLGPMGTGGLVIGDRVDEQRMQPIKQGGTGSRSEHEEHPDFLPDLCESGTPNAVGLAGLTAGIGWILDQGVERIRDREMALTGRLMEGLSEIKGITLYGGRDPKQRTATVAFNIEGLSPSEVALKLDEDHAIMSRPGLHCSPASHKTLGTFPEGSVRFGLGAFTQAEELERTLSAVARIAREVP
jgi:selenocysteine lyase/cysteine desulfurase